ncbi:RNA polymerase sigma factor [Marinicella meishanensis]|uniref:RNA polymerase sigma factor n=1 Tax=Marinicella meishanensis TaxID=2873263 RepID=UPI001CBC6F95|nr:sigma-70 family RNA polymerase sigma factor [Marinicella sp. NBU2979]
MTDQNTEAENLSKKAGELARGIMAGDQQSSSQFVNLHYRWLLFIVRKKFARVSGHEDIVQDSFLVVITKLQQGQVSNPDTIRAFLRTTAINIGYEYLRKDKKYASAVDQDSLEVFADARSDVLSSLEWDEGIKLVKQVMTELPTERDRQILTQFYFEDRDKPDICETLDLSSAHFDRVLYRAKQRLKELMQKHQDHDDVGKRPQQSKPFSTVKTSNKGPKLVSKWIHALIAWCHPQREVLAV